MDTNTIQIPDLTHAEQSALNVLIVQWRAKRRRNILRAGFYDMKNATHHLLASTVPETIRRRKFVLGWSALAVDKLSRRCNLEGFYDKNGNDLDALGMSELIESNRLLAEVSQTGTSSLIHAVAWLVTTKGDTEAGEPPVLMTGRSALTGTGVWDRRRRELGSFLSIAATDDRGEPVEMTMYLADGGTDGGESVTMTRADGKWQVSRTAHAYGVPVDPLRYQPRLERPFGSSRLSRAVMSIHEQAISAMFRADVNGEAYSLPRYVLLGATEDAFQSPDGSSKPAWLAAWDAVWAIGDDEDRDDSLARADVKQFTGQSPEPQNAHLRMLAQMFSGETSIPVGELGIMGETNPTSYEALVANRDDIIATAETTTDDWSPDLSSAATRALGMLNDSDLPPDLWVQPRWRPPQYVSRAAAADAGSKVIDKLPWLAETEVGMELLGLSSEQISRASSELQRARGQATLDRLTAGTTSPTPSTSTTSTAPSTAPTGGNDLA